MELLVLRSLILPPNLLARTTHTPQDFHLKTDALRGEVQPLNALIYQLYLVPCGPPQGELVLYMFLCFLFYSKDMYIVIGLCGFSHYHLQTGLDNSWSSIAALCHSSWVNPLQHPMFKTSGSYISILHCTI